MSGRGGTGKTEVVSAVLRAAEEGLKAREKGEQANTSLLSSDGVDSNDSFMTCDREGEANRCCTATTSITITSNTITLSTTTTRNTTTTTRFTTPPGTQRQSTWRSGVATLRSVCLS